MLLKKRNKLLATAVTDLQSTLKEFRVKIRINCFVLWDKCENQTSDS